MNIRDRLLISGCPCLTTMRAAYYRGEDVPEAYIRGLSPHGSEWESAFELI
jgi:hypothetical protein